MHYLQQDFISPAQRANLKKYILGERFASFPERFAVINSSWFFYFHVNDWNAIYTLFQGHVCEVNIT